MFVTTHVLSGVLVGRASRGRPALAFAAGVGSHLLLDSFPHWGCDKAAEGAWDTFITAAKRDGVMGLIASAAALAAVGKRDRITTAAAILGAVLLDLDKPMLYYFGVNPFPRLVAGIHTRVQNESPDGMGKELAYGIAMTAADAITVYAARRSSMSG